MLERVLFVLRWLGTEVRFRWRLGAMGWGCQLSPARLVRPCGIFLGSRVGILWGARLETHLLGNGAPPPRLELCDGVSIGQNFHCTCASRVFIGARTGITANVTITDIDHPYKDVSIPILDAPMRTAPVVIGSGCIIYNGAVILPGTTIGDHCVISANSVVRGRFSDRCVIAGAPARVVRRYDAATGLWKEAQD